MLNTAMELAQCEKCQAYVFQCHSGGLRVIVDPGPLDGMEDVRRRLVMGRAVFRILPGRKLAPFGPLSTKGTGYLAEHWCTDGVVRAQPVPTEPVGPLSAPVTPSVALGLPSAPESGSQGLTAPRVTIMDSSPGPSSRAKPAIRPRTDPKPTRCDTCGVLIRHDTPDTFAIEYDGRLVYAQHVAC